MTAPIRGRDVDDETLSTHRVLPRSAAAVSGPFLRDRLAALLAAFGLDAQQTAIFNGFDAIFGQGALDTEAGTRLRWQSRLTEDGTPIQFATMVGPPATGLRFVGDPAPPTRSNGERLRASVVAMEELASVLGVAPELAMLRPLIATLMPDSNRQLLADPAGALWLGAAFANGARPRMRIYLNASWGSRAERFARMRKVAERFDSAETWRRAESVLPGALQPLGVALALERAHRPRAALYFRAFGLRLDDYVRLARDVAGQANAATIAAFGVALLGDEAPHPASSAVLSFGFCEGSNTTADLEFCAHCLFRDDAEAERRLLGVLDRTGIDPTSYRRMMSCLQEKSCLPEPPRIHSFVGVSGKSSSPAVSVYLKPVRAAHG